MKRRVLIRRLLSVLGLTVVITTLAAVGLNAQVFGGFERRATDALFPAAPDSPNIAVVGIDNKTIERFGPLPPRDQVGALVDRLHEAGAAVIAFDVLYQQDKEGDDAMGAAIARAGNVILAKEPTIGPAVDGIYTTKDLSPIAADLGDPANYAVGQVNLSKDPSDGISRSLPLVVNDPENVEFKPALSIAAVMMFRGIDPTSIIVRPNGVQIGDRFVPT